MAGCEERVWPTSYISISYLYTCTYTNTNKCRWCSSIGTVRRLYFTRGLDLYSAALFLQIQRKYIFRQLEEDSRNKSNHLPLSYLLTPGKPHLPRYALLTPSMCVWFISLFFFFFYLLHYMRRCVFGKVLVDFFFWSVTNFYSRIVTKLKEIFYLI